MSELAFRRNYTLQLPSNYVDVNQDEMEYLDGGGLFSWLNDKAKGMVIGFVITLGVSSCKKSIIGDVYEMCSRYIGGEITSAIGFLIDNPAAALGLLAAAAATVFCYGRALHKW